MRALGKSFKNTLQSQQKIVVKWMVDRINLSGYNGEQLTMKSDNEDSIVALHKATAAMRYGETVLIKSPVRSSKSNGRMENAVRRWQSQLRTIKHFTESRIKKKIPAESALFSWLVVLYRNPEQSFHWRGWAYRLRAHHKTSLQALCGRMW